MTDAHPIDDAPNRHRDAVTRFRQDYSDALEVAVVSAEHTATEGWQKLYASHHEDLRVQRRLAAVKIRELADELEDAGLTDTEAKELAEAKKVVELLNERAAYFENRTVAPVAKPVHQCAAIIETYLSLARREEAEAPLLQSGLEELMRQAISEQPRPTFDADTGVVSIAESAA